MICPLGLAKSACVMGRWTSHLLSVISVVCSGPPGYPFVLVAGDSQLRTFVSGRVSFPNEWAVLSVPGGRFSHLGDAIDQVGCRDFLGRENPNAIVLMCGTNDLVSAGSQSWKENFRRLLHRCQYLFPQVQTYAIAPLPRCDYLRHLVPHITIAMGEVCAEFPSYVVLLDFSKEFPMSDTFLCALNDPVHLSAKNSLCLIPSSVR